MASIHFFPYIYFLEVLGYAYLIMPGSVFSNHHMPERKTIRTTLRSNLACQLSKRTHHPFPLRLEGKILKDNPPQTSWALNRTCQNGKVTWQIDSQTRSTIKRCLLNSLILLYTPSLTCPKQAWTQWIKITRWLILKKIQSVQTLRLFLP